jgi:hypothetical protein
MNEGVALGNDVSQGEDGVCFICLGTSPSPIVVAGVRSCRGRRGRLSAANNLADSLARQGKYDEAEKMEREVLAARKRVLGAEHPNTLSTGPIWLYPSRAKESTMRRRRWSARCLQ